MMLCYSQCLQDTKHYVVVAAPPVGALTTQLQRLLSRWQHLLTPTMFQFMLAASNGSFTLPRPYAMPKLHKLPAVDTTHLSQLTARVIVPCHSWVTTAASQFLAHLLNDVCSTKFPHVLPDSRTLIRSLDGALVSAAVSWSRLMWKTCTPPLTMPELYANVQQRCPGPMRMLVEQFLQFVLGNMFCQRDGTMCINRHQVSPWALPVHLQ